MFVLLRLICLLKRYILRFASCVARVLVLTVCPHAFSRVSAFFLSSAKCVIFNRCFADVVPVPKVSNPKNISDYRPISMLPVMSKPLAKLFLRKIIFPLVTALYLRTFPALVVAPFLHSSLFSVKLFNF